MFELDDSKFGKVKVVNITEARSSMAAMMNDNEASYVILKNNRPIRVVVSYDFFKRAQSPTQNSTQATVNPSNEVAGSPKVKVQEPKDHLKGLIKSRERDIKGSLGHPLPPAETAMEEKKESSEFVHENQKLVQEETPRALAVNETAQPPPSSFSAWQAQDKAIDPIHENYFARYRKLYESTNEVLEANPFLKKEPEASVEESFELPSSIPSESGSVDPPSIQDLLRELENEKLSSDDDFAL